MKGNIEHLPINRNQTVFKGLRHYKSVRRKKTIVAGLITSYVLLIFFGIYTLFSSQLLSKSFASNTNVEVKSSLKIENKEEYKLGENINTSLRIENISADKTVENVKIKLISTNNAVKWEGVKMDKLHGKDSLIQGKNDVFEIGNLSASNHLSLDIQGILNDTKNPYLAVFAEVEFTVLNKVLKTTSNKSFVKLSDVKEISPSFLKLNSSKTVFEFAEDVNLDLKYETDESGLTPHIAGSILINGQKGDNIASESCVLGDSSQCQKTFKNLPPDNYSAIFISDDNSIFSQIFNFQVLGSGSDFTPSLLANLNFPLGKTTINGTLPVYANSVLDQNTPVANKMCSFEILKDVNKQPVKKVTAPVSNERNCMAIFKTADLPESGEYFIRLAKTPDAVSVYFANANTDLLPLAIVENENVAVNKDVKINSFGVKSLFQDEVVVEKKTEETEKLAVKIEKEGKKVNENIAKGEKNEETIKKEIQKEEVKAEEKNKNQNEKTEEKTPELKLEKMLNSEASIGILHYESGDYKEINNGQMVLKYNNGNLEATLPASYFLKGGFYQIFIKTVENKNDKKIERFSDFVGFSYNSNEGLLSASGIEIKDLNNLIVGKNNEFTLKNIKDSNGNIQNGGECSATFYTSNKDFFNITGPIKNGDCTIYVHEGKIKKAGNILLTFYNNDKNKSIAQSRVLKIRAGNAKHFGQLVFENEPVEKQVANNLILGPVVDEFKNLTNAYGYHLKIYNFAGKDNSQKEIIYTTKIDIENGFAKNLIPASVFSEKKLKFEIVNGANETVISREVEPVVNMLKRPIYQIPKEVKSVDSINVSAKILSEKNICTATIFSNQNLEENVKIDGKINKENQECVVDFNAENKPNWQNLLLKFENGDLIKYQIIKQNSSDPSVDFLVAPSVYTDSAGLTTVSFLTSNITDQAGISVKNIKMNMEINGRLYETEVNDGTGKVSLYAKDILSRDMKYVMNTKFLNLDVDAKASLNSMSKTTNVRIGLNGLDMALENVKIQPLKFESKVLPDETFTFVFKTANCKVNMYTQKGLKAVNIHKNGEKCYIQSQAEMGKNILIFEDKGHEIASFEFKGEENVPKMIWCNSSPCKNQIVTQKNGKLEGKILNKDEEFNFASDESNTVLELKKEGLNSLKEYLVQTKFTDIDGEVYIYHNNILGSLMQ